MGSFGANFGPNFAGFASISVITIIPTKKVTADLCVNLNVKENLCAKTSVTEDLCTTDSISEDLCN